MLPKNRASHFSKKSIILENDGLETKQIQRRADHWIFEAGQSEHAPFLRLVLGALSLGALSHFLTVFLASPGSLHIYPPESWKRSFVRRTLPIMSMAITFYIPAESFSRALEHPCQIWIGNLDLRLLICGRRRQTRSLTLAKAGIKPSCARTITV